MRSYRGTTRSPRASRAPAELHPELARDPRPLPGQHHPPTMIGRVRCAQRDSRPGGAVSTAASCRARRPDELLGESARAWATSTSSSSRSRPPRGGTRSPVDTPLAGMLREYVESIEPGALVLPSMSAGLHELALPARGVRHRRLRLLATRTRPRSTRCTRPCTRPTSGSTRTISPWRAVPRARVPNDRRIFDERQPLRLGGMALRNGLLVHGPTPWAAGRARADGPHPRGLGAEAGARGPRCGCRWSAASLRMGEMLALLPSCGAALPEARLPVRGRAGSHGGHGARRDGRAAQQARGRARRRSRPSSLGPGGPPARRRWRSVTHLAGYHGAEHKAIGAYEQGGTPSTPPRSTSAAARTWSGPLVLPRPRRDAVPGRLPERAGARPGRTAARSPRWASPSRCSPGCDRNRGSPCPEPPLPAGVRLPARRRDRGALARAARGRRSRPRRAAEGRGRHAPGVD